jgi:hypothetical protein
MAALLPALSGAQSNAYQGVRCAVASGDKADASAVKLKNELGRRRLKALCSSGQQVLGTRGPICHM